MVFLCLYAWPFIERRLFGDRRHHELLARPRDDPRRSGVTAAFLAWVFIVFAAGATDRVFLVSGSGNRRAGAGIAAGDCLRGSARGGACRPGADVPGSRSAV